MRPRRSRYCTIADINIFRRFQLASFRNMPLMHRYGMRARWPNDWDVIDDSGRRHWARFWYRLFVCGAVDDASDYSSFVFIADDASEKLSLAIFQSNSHAFISEQRLITQYAATVDALSPLLRYALLIDACARAGFTQALQMLTSHAAADTERAVVTPTARRTWFSCYFNIYRYRAALISLLIIIISRSIFIYSSRRWMRAYHSSYILQNIFTGFEVQKPVRLKAHFLYASHLIACIRTHFDFTFI